MSNQKGASARRVTSGPHAGKWSKPCRVPGCLGRHIAVSKQGAPGKCKDCERKAERERDAARARGEAATQRECLYRATYRGLREVDCAHDTLAQRSPFADPDPMPESEVERRAETLRLMLAGCGCGGGYKIRRASGSV